MFEKLRRLFSGKKSILSIPAKADTRDAEMIELIDGLGRPMKITRKEWRINVLPATIKENWNNPDQLSTVIISALDDGFIAEVEEAAKHLVDIDTNSERCICLYGIVLMKLSKYKESEEVFLQYLRQHPKTGIVLTNLAKAQESLGNHSLAMTTLEEGLNIDPNQDNGLGWWIAMRREALLKEGFDQNQANLAAFEEANKRFGGWRTDLWLGSYYLSQKQREHAISLFEKVLASNWTPDVLTHISGELGKNGYIEEIINIIAKRYIPQQHDFLTGINLLQAYLELKRVEEGKHLLDILFNLHRLNMEQRLLWYQSEFDKLSGIPQPVSMEKIAVEMRRIDSPLWCYGWDDEKTGFENIQSGKKVALLQFSWEPDQQITQPTVGHEDEPGRLVRSIPLYLLEDIYYGSDVDPSFLFPTTQNGAFILFSTPLGKKQLQELAQNGYVGALTGKMSSNQLSLTYWNLMDRLEQTHTFQFDITKPEKVIPLVEKFFFDTAGIKFDPGFNHSARGFQKISDDQSMRHYLLGLGQQLTIQMAVMHDDFAKKMYGERNMIRWLLDDAIYTPILQTQLAMLSAIQKCVRYKSRAIRDYEQQISLWLANYTENPNPIQKLAKKVALSFNKFCKK